MVVLDPVQPPAASPTTSPITSPPTIASTNDKAACPSENVPNTTAATAAR